VRPIIGRDFLAGEDRLIAGPYPALISENYWQRRFGRDPAVLGRIFILSGFPTRVVGITPKDFMGTRPEVPDFWVIASAFGDPQRRELDRTNLCCALTARLKPGNPTLRQAQAEMAALADSRRREYPEAERRFRITAGPATRFGGLKDNFVVLFSILQVAMGLVLLIACSNVAGLLLGRAVARQREIAVRLAVGASRNRLIRQLLAEGVLLSTIAGALAFLVAWQTLAALGRSVSSTLATSGGAIAIDFNPDLRVFSYSFAISVLAGLFFALAPALQCTRPDLVTALKEENAGLGGGGRGWMRGWIVAAQIALCLTLLIGAGLLTSSSVRLLSVDPGFDTRDVLTLRMPSPQELGYTDARARDLQARLYQRIRALPGVVSVAFASRIPLGGNVTTTRIAPYDGSSGQASGEQRFPYT
jgi:predicted permease